MNTLITTTEALQEACAILQESAFVTVDTEFLRDKTYYPKLCLVQLAGEEHVYAVDPLVEDIDLSSLFELMYNKEVLKVFHAGRQDIEILEQLGGGIPTPLFDTQVAASVCGFGEAAGYQTLVSSLLGVNLDKTCRFTDWSHRPLSDRQLEYALSDVTYLRDVYQQLSDMLDKRNRHDWLKEEVALLEDPNTFRVLPEDAWKKIRVRSTDPFFLYIVKKLAAWREERAQDLNIPRGYVLADPVLLEIAALLPKDKARLSAIKKISKIATFQADILLGIIAEAVANKKKIITEGRRAKKKETVYPKGGDTVELLRVLLKHRAAEYEVAEKLVANNHDLTVLTYESNQGTIDSLRCMQGWRFRVFGEDALSLKQGKLALSLDQEGDIIVLKQEG